MDAFETQLQGLGAGDHVITILEESLGPRRPSRPVWVGLAPGCCRVTLILPNARSIPTKAFEGCSVLVRVAAPVATEIGEAALYGCSSLARVDAPIATKIELCAFEHCQSLTHVDLPAATCIESAAFAQCTSLTRLNAPVAVNVHANAFWRSPLTRVWCSHRALASVLNHATWPVMATTTGVNEVEGWARTRTSLRERFMSSPPASRARAIAFALVMMRLRAGPTRGGLPSDLVRVIIDILLGVAVRYTRAPIT